MPVDRPLAAARITALAQRWTFLRLVAWTVAAGCLAVASWLVSGNLPISLAAAVLVAIGAWSTAHRRPITPLTVARHLDRVAPELEESAALLLEPVDNGDPLRRMQRRRADAALGSMASVPVITAPATRFALITSFACLVAATLFTMLPAPAPATSRATTPTAPGESVAPLELGAIIVQWTPPSYLGRTARTTAPSNVTVEEGSVVQWQVDAPRASRVRIVDLLGDTLVAVQRDGHWMATATISNTRVWRAEALDDADSIVRSEAFRLSVIPDRPPIIAIIAPPGRTEMEWTEPHRVVLRAVVSDDYAIGSTTLLATVAAGRGEGVRFRERRLSLEHESTTRSGEMVMSAMIDLDALEVAPGDEVYLAVEASDRKAPAPQVARSETVFLALRDTLDPVSSDFGGIAIDIEPEFFRSQRQIILDTEALLADVRAGRVREPLPRAMDIGYDQYLLRVRYGEIAGQEDEVNGADPSATVTEADLMHQHDTEDNATLLAASVKATLQSALAAMWEAEKQLRTGHPAEALPHEYRALVSLEQIRQAQRAYVKRIGFEPPAIDVGRTRLTKQATDVAPLDRRPADQREAPGDALHAALRSIDAVPTAAYAPTLEAAARQLAAQAVDDATGQHLETLGALRRMLDGDRSPGTLERIRSGLLSALPAPPRPIIPQAPR
jgi:hypothetical protein